MSAPTDLYERYDFNELLDEFQRRGRYRLNVGRDTTAVLTRHRTDVDTDEPEIQIYLARSRVATLREREVIIDPGARFTHLTADRMSRALEGYGYTVSINQREGHYILFNRESEDRYTFTTGPITVPVSN